MAKPSLLYSSLCLLLFTSACLANTDRFNECQLDRLNALEPDNRIESQAGIIETWNSNNPELRCAGVTIEKHIIEPEGLHLPSYTNYPQLIMIVQGEGAFGISVPGCSETFQEPQSPQSQPRQGSRTRRSQSQSQEQEQQDSHQKIRRFREGDIIAIPPGIAYWTYNYGNQQIIAINLLDTTSIANQLDPNPRRFYIAGNPEEEYPETQPQGQQQTQPGGRRQGQHQEGEEEEGSSNVLSGFDPRFLTQALNIDEEIVNRLQNPNDRRKQIIRIKGGLTAIIPEWQEGEEEEEQEQEQEPSQRGQHGQREEEEQQPRSREQRESRRRGGQQGKGQGRHEEEETEHTGGRKGGHEWERTTRRRRGRGEGGEETEEEETTTRERRQRGSGQGEEDKPNLHRSRIGGRLQGRSNGIEETICSAELRENIADPSRADLFNPTAGRISTVNSLTLPILRWFQLSAEYVSLYKNGIYAPHWNIDANSVIYVTRGSGWVQVVNCQGNSVYNDKLRRGQVLVVPQNFVVAHQAGEDGFEFIAFKTNDRAITSPLKQVFRAIPAEVLANAFGLRLNQVSELKYNGNQGPLISPPQSQDRILIKAA